MLGVRKIREATFPVVLAQQRTQQRQGLVQRLAASGSAKARQHLNRTGMSAVNGRDKVHNFLPLRRNLARVTKAHNTLIFLSSVNADPNATIYA
jgi:hypothetical protein